MDYGECDHWPDGSYVTTEWFAVGFIPCFPASSKRISSTRFSEYSTYDAKGGYWIYAETGVHRKQALRVYLWLACFFLPLFVFNRFGEWMASAGASKERAATILLAWMLITAAMPMGLRRLARARKARQWKQETLAMRRGSHPSKPTRTLW
jgi:hypothetical protein